MKHLLCALMIVAPLVEAGSIMRITNEADENGVEQCLSRGTGRVCSLCHDAVTNAASS
jgi:hypothetical protein